MADLREGERVSVQGASGVYQLERRGAVYRCSCPAWQKLPASPERRTCKHLRAYLGDAHETARVGAAARLPRVPPRPSWVPHHREDREVRARRRTELGRVLAGFPAVYRTMLDVWGLRLPRHIAYAAGWWLALTDAERSEAWAYVGTGLFGITEWFLPRGLERRVLPGLDGRLDGRYRREPPEMVTVFGGNSDGGHWGLWYDDPAELPTVIAHNWARDSAETSAREPTLLSTLRKGMLDVHEPLAPEFAHVGAIVDWLDEVLPLELAAHRDEAIAPFVHRPDVVGGIGPWVPGHVLPAALGDAYARASRYLEHAPVVDSWIALARAELARGSPGLALTIGRELHWCDDDATREACRELLVGAYRALGRDALAEIVIVHHRHRDLASVGVYEAAPPSDFAAAWGRGDRDAMLLALRDGAPPDAADALMTTDPAWFRWLLDLDALDAAVERAALFHFAQIAFWRDRDDATYAEQREPHRAALLTMLSRRKATGPLLLAAHACGDAEIAAAALASADLSWRSERGRTALHVVCRAAWVDAVRALLARGADPCARDHDGETPNDAARDGWIDHRAEASTIFEMLREATGAAAAPAPPPPPGALAPSCAVTHARFGAGVVQSVEGEGEGAKVTISFADGSIRTLLARFVSRA